MHLAAVISVCLVCMVHIDGVLWEYAVRVQIAVFLVVLLLGRGLCCWFLMWLFADTWIMVRGCAFTIYVSVLWMCIRIGGCHLHGQPNSGSVISVSVIRDWACVPVCHVRLYVFMSDIVVWVWTMCYVCWDHGCVLIGITYSCFVFDCGLSVGVLLYWL